MYLYSELKVVFNIPNTKKKKRETVDCFACMAVIYSMQCKVHIHIVHSLCTITGNTLLQLRL